MIRFRLDPQSGVPFYRQITDQIQAGIASGALRPGEKLPTVRQLAVDLAVNYNTALRAYKELEIRGVLVTQQGSGTFVGTGRVSIDEVERRKRLNRLLDEMSGRAGSLGLTLGELAAGLNERLAAIASTEEAAASGPGGDSAEPDGRGRS